jgi:hypothetical protein
MPLGLGVAAGSARLLVRTRRIAEGRGHRRASLADHPHVGDPMAG